MVSIPAAMSTAAPSNVFLPIQLGSGGFIQLAIVFVILAIVAAVFGARGVAGLSMSIAKWLVIIFIVLAILSILL